MPDLAVVIVSWNVRDLLAACLRSLFSDLDQSGLQAQVWVVDNGSADGSPIAATRALGQRPLPFASIAPSG